MLGDALRERARAAPDGVAYIFLRDGEAETGRLTYGGLYPAARAIAAFLQGAARPIERALLVYPPGLEFVAALWGCFYAGVAPCTTVAAARTAGRSAGAGRSRRRGCGITDGWNACRGLRAGCRSRWRDGGDAPNRYGRHRG